MIDAEPTAARPGVASDTEAKPTAFACPTCSTELAECATDYRCTNRHNFDKARQGYVNLLPVSRRRASGDSSESVAARRSFHVDSPYEPLAAVLTELAARAGGRVVLDAGCGEGYYLRCLAEALSLRRDYTYGVDMSKPALRAAATQGKTIARYAVASTFRLPVRPHTVGLLIKVFAPLPTDEVLRVLEDDGLVLEVLPGAQHLRQLRELVYATYRPHADEQSNAIAEASGLSLAVQRDLQFDMALPIKKRQDLITMTPYRYHTGAVDLSDIVDRLPRVTADFRVRMYQR